jgi:hypothetical protein
MLTQKHPRKKILPPSCSFDIKMLSDVSEIRQIKACIAVTHIINKDQLVSCLFFGLVAVMLGTKIRLAVR